MLWEKEFEEHDALYVNLFKSFDHNNFKDFLRHSLSLHDDFLQSAQDFIKGNDSIAQLFYSMAIKGVHNENASTNTCKVHKKDNRFSLQYRMEGNQKFAQKNLLAAMELYNKSLCFAENGSEHLSLAYANRSSCFLLLKMYEKCLVDIQLAIDANYPEQLMQKLDKRKTECLKLLETAKRHQPYKPKLNFDADVNFPGMANVLKITKNDEFGRHIIAKSNIEVGQTVLIEKPFAAVLVSCEYKRCANCLKPQTNFIACKKCTNAMFCSAEFSANEFQYCECEMIANNWTKNKNARDIERLVLRSVIAGINTFSTVDEMMQFVNECNSSEPDEVTKSTADSVSKYRTFFKRSGYDSKPIIPFIRSAYIVYIAILSCPNFGIKFQSEAKKRFLMHLINHHTLIIPVNVQSITVYDPANESNDDFGRGLNCIGSNINHSCMPNVVCYTYQNLPIYTAILPIKKGEQLFMSYLGQEGSLTSTEERHDKLMKNYRFECKCQICKLRYPPFKISIRLSMEESFNFVLRNSFSTDSKMLIAVKKNCIDFLNKYGRISPTAEILHIHEILHMLLVNEAN